MAMSSATNQVRVTAPAQDRRLQLVSEALIRAAVPDALAPILAEGFVHRLRRLVWVSLDDVIGSGDDLESILGWKGPARTLAKALQEGRYVEDVHGVLCATDAIVECPEYIKQRWRRNAPARFQAARKRAQEPNIVHEEDSLKDREDTPGVLFGVATGQQGEKASVRSKPKPQPPGHQQVIDYFHGQYAQHVNPAGYVWSAGDAKLAAQLVKRVGDIHRIIRAIDAYFAERDKFYQGKPFRKLAADFPRFDRPDSPGGNPGLNSQAATDSARL